MTIWLTSAQISMLRLGVGVSLLIDGTQRWVVSEFKPDGYKDASFVVLQRATA